VTQTQFFNHIIDGYLLHDLKNMAAVELGEGEDKGALGYPMLATIASGMELLGGLLQTDHIYHDVASNSAGYFAHYWDNYLSKKTEAYEPYRGTFWQLVRHGVAHTYIAKVGITVSKNLPEAHLITHARNRLNIDCNELYKDFVASYLELAKPKFEQDADFASRVQLNVDALLSGSETRSSQFIAGDEAATVITTTASGIADTMPVSTTMIPDDIRHP
jgi:hypothetical protein